MNADGVESAPPESPGGDDEESIPPRSHRRGMLAGLGVLGLVLAGLLLFGPGGTKPRPAVQGQAGRSPVTIPVGSETTTAASSTTTTTAPAPPTPQTGPVTDLAASTFQVKVPTPAATHASTPTNVPNTTVPRAPAPVATTTTTAAAPPPTTTTTSPPVTTTTTCILILCD
jgi:hypothetical protein